MYLIFYFRTFGVAVAGLRYLGNVSPNARHTQIVDLVAEFAVSLGFEIMSGVVVDLVEVVVARESLHIQVILVNKQISLTYSRYNRIFEP